MVKRSKRRRHVMSVSAAKTAKKRIKKKAKRKPQESATLSSAWDAKKTVKQNMSDAGLVANMMDFASSSTSQKQQQRAGKKKQADVIERMEVEAKSQVRDPQYRLAEPQVLFCVHMMQRYGDDYEAMAHDSTNHYQETPKQIRKKIQHFKRSAQYSAYTSALSNAS